MTDGHRSIVRRIFGQPRIWLGCVYLSLGIFWTVLSLLEGHSLAGSPFQFVIGSLYFVLGVPYLAFALRDRRRGEGAYRSRTSPAEQTNS
jgi:ABC-type Fe3+-siderophore transport system permease subunit